MNFREENINSLILPQQQKQHIIEKSSKQQDFIDLITSDTAKDNYIYLQSIGEFHPRKNFYTERKDLDSYYIHYTLSGKGRLFYQDKEYTLIRNQLFFIDCRQYQKYEMWDCESWDHLWLHAFGGNISNYHNLYMQDGSPVCQLSESSIIPVLMRRLYEYQKPITRYTEPNNAKKLVELLTEIIIAKDDPDSESSEIPPYILAIQQLFEQNYSASFTLDDLAKNYTVNKYRLVREFKKHIGLSPIDYLINKRITMAQDLLRNTNWSILDIASQVGIPNINNFIILFKKRTQVTPLVYRKMW